MYYGPPPPPYWYPQYPPQRENIVDRIKGAKAEIKELEELLKEKEKKDDNGKKKGAFSKDIKLADAMLAFFAFGGLFGIPLALFQIAMLKHFLEVVGNILK